MKIEGKGPKRIAAVVGGVALLGVLAVVGGFASRPAHEPQAATPTASAVAAPAIEEAPAPVGEPISRIYFEQGSANLPPKAMNDLSVALGAAAVKTGAIVLVSGFYGTAGGTGNDAELATQRARAVRTALLRSGLADYRIRLSRPAEAATKAAARDARRVELRVQ